MQCVIRITEMNNAAFTEGVKGYELANVLMELARKVREHPGLTIGYSLKAYDSNGNVVGKLEIGI